MTKKPEVIDDDNPEWTNETTARAVKFDQLPEGLQQKLRRVRGPQKAPTKIQTAMRLDVDVVKHFKAGGDGWQTRMNEALKKAIEAGIA